MAENPYQSLAERLNSLPSGFPPTEDGAEIRILENLFTPEEAALAAQLRLNKATPDEIAARVGGEPTEIRKVLKAMAKRGLIEAGRTENGMGYGLMPFVVGIYEMQVGRIDAEFAQLFEAYFQQAFGEMLSISPKFHRVVPVSESVSIDMEIHPHESVAEIVEAAEAWGVVDCICRTQKELIGDPCEHPKDVCMVFGQTPGMFDQSSTVRSLDRSEALHTLERAAEAGLVHSVSNSKEGHWYVCNCCKCSCGILRGLADLGMADAIASSPFVCQVDLDLCYGCELCLDRCQFGALTYETRPAVEAARCVGCGLCVTACPEDALFLVRRPDAEITAVPTSKEEWRQDRAATRGLDIGDLLAS